MSHRLSNILYVLVIAGDIDELNADSGIPLTDPFLTKLTPVYHKLSMFNHHITLRNARTT